MTSPLPPKRRDTRTPWDLLRQDRTNLRQLNNGLVGGRAPMLRPLPGPLADGDDFDDDAGDDDQPAAWNLDTATAAVAGQVSLALTYEPIDGTLLVFWDGEYLHPSEYVLAGQTVTFTDRHVHVGDRLDAAFWYWPADVQGAPGPATLTLRGTSKSADSFVPLAGLPLPAATQVGDLIVVAANGDQVTFADSRLTLVGNCMWIGFASNLTNIACSASASGHWSITCTTYATNATGWTAAVTSTAGSGPLAIPTVPNVAAAVCAIDAYVSFIIPTMGVPTGWTYADSANTNVTCTQIDYWTSDTLATSPAGPSTPVTIIDGSMATVVGLIGPEI